MSRRILAGWCVLLLSSILGYAVEPAFIPVPQKVEMKQGSMPISTSTRIVTNERELLPLADVIAGELQMLTGIRPALAEGKIKQGDIVLKFNPALKGETYSVQVGRVATLSGGTYQAVAMASVTMIQSLGRKGIPHMTIKDAPDSPFRSVMVDVARRYNSIDTLKQCVILCRFYKVNYLHLHLTDDHAWTFPSDAFPKLGTGNHGFRGPTPIVYDKQELLDLVAFADARGVTLIPELDMPSHSTSLRRAYPELFDAGEKKPKLNLVNMSSETAYESLAVLIAEMCEVFKSSPYFHIGADEVYTPYVSKAPGYKAYIEKHGLKNERDLFFHFINRMDEIVKANGKKSIIWADHATGTKNVTIPNDIICMAWRANSSAAKGFVRDGYPVINATWVPLYVVNQIYHTVPVEEDGRNKHRPETIYDWNLYEFHTTTLEPTDTVIGAQICAWEQGGEAQMPTLRDRLPAMSERSWDVDGKNDWAEYSKRYAATDARLERLIYPFQAKVSPITSPNRWLAPLLDGYYVGPGASCILFAIPGVTLRYTMEDKAVPADASVVKGPIALEAVDFLSVQAFDAQNRPLGERWAKKIEHHFIASDLTGMIMLDYTLAADGHIVQTATEIPQPNQGKPPRQFKGEATVTLNALTSGTIHYTLDGQTPTVESPVYSTTLKINDSCTMKAALFNASGKQVGKRWEYIFVNIQPVANLTLHKPTFETLKEGEEKPVEGISPAVDGLLNKDHWGAGYAPASLKIDLEGLHNLKAIQVFPYYLDHRHYTYFIEVSTDNKTWTEVADARKNKKRATAAGHLHEFAPTQARYIRVTMLSNSANRAVHLCEVRAFE